MIASDPNNERGEYGDTVERRKVSVGSVGLVLGLGAAIYALSPGARHWYKHGRLPEVRR